MEERNRQGFVADSEDMDGVRVSYSCRVGNGISEFVPCFADKKDITGHGPSTARYISATPA